MASITIRNLDDGTKERLRRLAAERGHSMEEEARRILARAVNLDEERGLATTIMGYFSSVGGVELEIPPRSPVRPAPRLADD